MAEEKGRRVLRCSICNGPAFVPATFREGVQQTSRYCLNPACGMALEVLDAGL